MSQEQINSINESIGRLEESVQRMVRLLDGDDDIGLKSKVNIMWKVGIFVGCTVVIETVALVYAFFKII